MATTVSLINMKGGVGKTTLTFNLAWYSAWQADLRVLAVDLDPQANLSQYFMGAKKYLEYIQDNKCTVVEIFEQFSPPHLRQGSPTLVSPNDVIYKLHQWSDGSLLHLIPSRLELAWTLKNPTDKAQLLPQLLAEISNNYDLILIDCAPTESILTRAAYQSSQYILVPVKPEFLATIGLPLLARSLEEYHLMHKNHKLDMAGIIFNGKRRVNTPPEQNKSCETVRKLASKHNWNIFDSEAYYSDSYPTGSREGSPIFMTSYARNYVKNEFQDVGNDFLKSVGLKFK